ncbi:MAG: DUF2249 domain-containing protein [Azovibrio sp.]
MTAPEVPAAPNIPVTPGDADQITRTGPRAVTGVVHTLDARWLSPPEPMVRTLEMLDNIGVDDELLLLLHREPFPLYDILWRNGFGHRVERLDDSEFAIHIRRRPA